MRAAKPQLVSKVFARVLCIVILSLTYLLTQWYVYLYPSYDASTFLIGALIPLFVSLLLPLAFEDRVMLYVFLAYFWALVEDAPVYLDSVYTWPEVTRFHPAEPHLFLEVIYHVLTALFLVLAVQQVRGGVKLGTRWVVAVILLMGSAFILAYAQNIPWRYIQDIVESQWYQLDMVEHVLSAVAALAALLLTWWRATRVAALELGSQQT